MNVCILNLAESLRRPRYLRWNCAFFGSHGNLALWQVSTLAVPETPTVTHDLRIARVQRTLQWFEQDIPLLNMRVKELSPERQASARSFAAAVIDQTRAELRRLLEQRPPDGSDAGAAPCEPAD